MSVQIPYVRQLNFEYGRAEQVSPGIRRVIAKNPSPFTYFGTGTYIVGTKKVAIVDPGPLDPEHIGALLAATKDEEITHIVVTHTHMDHSPGTKLLRAHCDAPTYGFGPHGSGHEDDNVVVEEGGDLDFDPDVRVVDGDVIEGEGWNLRCIFTPGHTSNHMCFEYVEENALFSGDHVMGWSTTVVSPPDGDMEKYIASLCRLLQERLNTYWPTHGPPITNPVPHVQAFIEHRLDREDQILLQLNDGVNRIEDMVPNMYVGVDRRLYPAAARSVLATIRYMVKKGTVVTAGEVTEESEYWPS